MGIYTLAKNPHKWECIAPEGYYYFHCLQCGETAPYPALKGEKHTECSKHPTTGTHHAREETKMDCIGTLAFKLEQQANRKAGTATLPELKPYKVRVGVIPTAVDVALGLAKPIEVGQVVSSEIITIYGTSMKDAMKRAGIQ